MVNNDLPMAIQQFIATTNVGDTQGFLSLFTATALIDDWGRKFHGPSGAADWNRTDNMGVNAHFDLVTFAKEKPDEWKVTLKVSGDGYNGTGPLLFKLADDKIEQLLIIPN
ncbi:Uncharacterised protein [Listeria grayi]|nr:nuclear transport factor 2 family protein [Listeria grayi]EUJ28724.1 ketosteroid isomerase family protein [Listeria grayi FSL F6-1183]MBC1922964.1 nuclear transport factor 2 family protein [Listeria grayi]STY44593.1 Uncharacterised protein [Listeria grayi]VEI36723.1 Uncharacterised protein [Listeria grayi]